MAYPMIVQGADEHQYSVTDQFTKHLTPNETTTPDTEYKTSYTNGSYEGSQGNTAISDAGSKNATLDNKYGVYEKNNSGADQTDQAVSKYSKVSTNKSSKQQYKGVEDVSSADKVKQSGVSPRIYRVPQKVMIGIGIALTSLVVVVIVVCIIFGAVIVGMKNDIDEANRKNEELEKRVEEFEGKQDESNVSMLLLRIEELEASLNNVTSDVSSVEDEYNELSADLTEVNVTAQATKESADQLRVELDVEKPKVSSLQFNLGLLNGELTAVDGRLTTAEGYIDNLKSRVACLENNGVGC